MDCNNILIKVSEDPEFSFYKIYHLTIDSEKNVKWYQILCDDYLFINPHLIKIKTRLEGASVYAFYNVLKIQTVSPFFHYISAFDYNEKIAHNVAQAIYFVPYDTFNYNQIITYLDEDGFIIYPYLDYDTGKYYEQNMSFADVVLSVKNDMSVSRKC